jgi:hypothetical protein
MVARIRQLVLVIEMMRQSRVSGVVATSQRLEVDSRARSGVENFPGHGPCGLDANVCAM